jgi:hypothetical protein
MNTQFTTTDSARLSSFAKPELSAASDAGVAASRGLFPDNDFFNPKSLDELAREQGVGPITDIRVFAGGLPDDADVDELIAQLEEIRGSSCL